MVNKLYNFNDRKLEIPWFNLNAQLELDMKISMLQNAYNACI